MGPRWPAPEWRASLGEVEPPDPKPLTLPRLLRRGVLRRCPLCGAGGVFVSWFEVRERCQRCHFPIRREEGHWIGAVGINTIVTFTALALTMLVAFALMWNERRAAPIFISSFLVAGVTPVAFFGSSQTLWSAIDLAMRPLEPGDDVDPRWIPPPVRRQ